MLRSHLPPQNPSRNQWALNHKAAVLRFADPLKPVVASINREVRRPFCLLSLPMLSLFLSAGVLACRFPQHCKFYSEFMDRLFKQERLHGRLHLRGVFASRCVKAAPVPLPTTFFLDSDVLFAGFYAILPFGFFDYCASARLAIDLGDGGVFPFELPMGMPLLSSFSYRRPLQRAHRARQRRSGIPPVLDVGKDLSVAGLRWPHLERSLPCRTEGISA